MVEFKDKYIVQGVIFINNIFLEFTVSINSHNQIVKNEPCQYMWTAVYIKESQKLSEALFSSAEKYI